MRVTVTRHAIYRYRQRGGGKGMTDARIECELKRLAKKGKIVKIDRNSVVLKCAKGLRLVVCENRVVTVFRPVKPSRNTYRSFRRHSRKVHCARASALSPW